MLISICIPAYKRADYLRRLLDSISIQTFRDFEVIVSDDSPGLEVKHLCDEFQTHFAIKYVHNSVPLGTPANWNASMRLATGDWIKLMHDDDWFSRKDSLALFVQAVRDNPGIDFIFSAYTNRYLIDDRRETVKAPVSRRKQLARDPVTLFASNIVGPPSVVMHRKDLATQYDEKVKWVVDIDFYVRYLRNRRFHYVDTPLVNVGIGDDQVTADCFRKRQVEIPEAFHLLQKTGHRHLNNILVYDGWWRLLRNLEIRHVRDVSESGFAGDIPVTIRSMIYWQSKFPLKTLRFGPLSKSLMFLNYIYNKKRIT